VATRNRPDSLEQALEVVGDTLPLPDRRRMEAILLALESDTPKAVSRRRMGWVGWLLLGATLSAAAAAGWLWAANRISAANDIPKATPSTGKGEESGSREPLRKESVENQSTTESTRDSASPRKNDPLIYLR